MTFKNFCESIWNSWVVTFAITLGMAPALALVFLVLWWLSRGWCR
jgi:hypothetical protein